MNERLLADTQAGQASVQMGHQPAEPSKMARIVRRLSFAAVGLSVGGCSLFSGYREVPASHFAKDQLEQVGSALPTLSVLQQQDRTSITFVAAFDGTMNDRMHVPRGEDATVVAKLYEYVQAPDMVTPAAGTSQRAKAYFKGPGCRLGLMCALDAATGYSSERTAREALKALQLFVKDRPAGLDLHVVVTGFSRGAATGRHFLNLVCWRRLKFDPPVRALPTQI